MATMEREFQDKTKQLFIGSHSNYELQENHTWVNQTKISTRGWEVVMKSHPQPRSYWKLTVDGIERGRTSFLQ